MVNQQSLDATFAALADPTRRGILEQLSRGQTKVTDLARPYQMSLPAVSKHLRVLERAGLIVRSRSGREHRMRVDPQPLQQARDWMAMYAETWQQQFDALAEFLEDSATGEEQDPTKTTRRSKRHEHKSRKNRR